MTPEEIKKAQKNALGKLWRIFGFNKSLMAEQLNTSRQTVNQWFKKGRISATFAILASEHELVKGKITKEEMRPDVKEWFGV